jgi:WS/DGAT/MGAT family acyltransferase
MALASTVRHQAQLVKTLASGLPGVAGLAKEVLPDLTGEAGSQLRAPSTRFGDKVTADRAFDGTAIELDDVAAVRNLVEGATVNDVILSIVGGAVRRYLGTHGELPDISLLSAVPVSLRVEGDTTPGNQVSVMALSLHTDVADPVERLAAIHASAVGARRVADALGTTHLADAAAHVPAAMAVVGTRLVARLGLNQQARRLFNTTVTNLPGPRAPSYACGARLVAHFGLGPVLDGVGLFHAVMGVERRLFLSVTSCGAMLPDPVFYRQCLDESIAEHTAAAP